TAATATTAAIPFAFITLFLGFRGFRKGVGSRAFKFEIGQTHFCDLVHSRRGRLDGCLGNCGSCRGGHGCGGEVGCGLDDVEVGRDVGALCILTAATATATAAATGAGFTFGRGRCR